MTRLSMTRLLGLFLFAAALAVAGAARAAPLPRAVQEVLGAPAPGSGMDDADFDVTEEMC